MPLDDVRTALREVAAAVPAAHVESGDVLARARRTVRHRRVVRAAIAVFLVLGVVGAIAATRPPKHTHVEISAAPSTSTTRPSPHASLTEEQLRAHDGVGVPAGWQPVDFGAARLFVPGDWVLQRGVACLGAAPRGVTVCNPTPYSTTDPAASAAMVSHDANRNVAPRIIHGYRVYAASDSLLFTSYDVPQLGVEIVLRGDLQWQVLATLAPSSRTVALAFAQLPSPGGHVVSTDGVQLTIPFAWPVDTPQSLGCAWPEAPALWRIRPNTLLANCPAIRTTDTRPLRDGVYVYTSSELVGSLRLNGIQVAVLQHRDTTIGVFQDPGDFSVLELFVRRAGSPSTHAVRLGLGPDGRIAGRILASIVAAS